jgi:hypothetical protein
MVTLTLLQNQEILKRFCISLTMPHTPFPSSGVFWYKYSMRLHCYDSYSTDPHTLDTLGACSHSYYAQPLGIRFYIRENQLSLALLADIKLVPRPTLDWIA